MDERGKENLISGRRVGEVQRDSLLQWAVRPARGDAEGCDASESGVVGAGEVGGESAGIRLNLWLNSREN